MNNDYSYYQKRKKRQEQDDEEEFYPNISDTASCTECTGLMQRPPRNAAEEEAYQELYSTETPKPPRSGQGKK